MPAASHRRTTLRELFSIDLRSLAALRIALALILLVDLGLRAPYLHVHYGEEGVFPAEAVRAPWYFSVYWLGGAGWATALYAITAAFGLMLLLGWQTRLATVASWLLAVSLQVHNPLLTNNGDILLRMLLLWGMFLPLGARWSLDARRRGPPASASVCSVGTVAVLLQFVVLYLCAGIVKNTNPWKDGTAIQLYLGNETLGRPLGAFLRGYPGLTELLGYATVAFELVGPVLLFLPWRSAKVRMWVVPVFWFFQLGLVTCFRLQLFPFASTAATLPFLPGRFWELFGSKPSATEDAPPPARSPLAKAWQAIAAVLFLFTAALNVPTLFKKSEWESLERTALARYSGIVQSWRLYAVVPRKDTSFELVGRRADGRTIDLVAPEAKSETRRWLRQVHDEYRMLHQLVLMLRRAEHYHPLLRRHLDWVCRTWNATHEGPGRLERLQMLRVERPILLEGHGPPQRSVVVEHTCASAGG